MEIIYYINKKNDTKIKKLSIIHTECYNRTSIEHFMIILFIQSDLILRATIMAFRTNYSESHYR